MLSRPCPAAGKGRASIDDGTREAGTGRCTRSACGEGSPRTPPSRRPGRVGSRVAGPWPGPCAPRRRRSRPCNRTPWSRARLCFATRGWPPATCRCCPSESRSRGVAVCRFATAAAHPTCTRAAAQAMDAGVLLFLRCTGTPARICDRHRIELCGVDEVDATLLDGVVELQVRLLRCARMGRSICEPAMTAPRARHRDETQGRAAQSARRPLAVSHVLASHAPPLSSARPTSSFPGTLQ